MPRQLHAWVRLGLAFILTVAIAVTLKKVCKSSQGNNFAYTLLAFSALLALVNLGFFFIFAFTNFEHLLRSLRFYYALLYVYSLQSIQIWLFAIKYYQSYAKSSFDGVLLSPRQVEWLKSSVIVVYIVSLTIIFAIILITGPFFSIVEVGIIEVVWTTLYAASFFLTVYSIVKLIAMLNAVVKTNRQLQINKFQLIAHCLVLATAVIGVVISSVYFDSVPRWRFDTPHSSTNIYLYLAVIETVGQLLICWICWQFAASNELVDSEMVMSRNKYGVITIKLVNRIGSNSTQGIGSVNSAASSNPTTETESEGVMTTECDEIVAQFLKTSSAEWNALRTQSEVPLNISILDHD